MAGFRFPLTTLLRLREAARDERRAQLADAFAVERALAAQEAELDGQLDELRLAARGLAQPGEVDLDRLLAANRHQLVLRGRRQLLRKQQMQVAAEIERRRLALVEADREVRVLEKLRARQAARHAIEEARCEIRTLDEVALRVAAKEDAP